MQCSYCNVAYALPDPNCRGCGAPKSADAVRRDLDVSHYRANPIPRHVPHTSIYDDEPPSTFNVLLSRGPRAIATIIFLIPLTLFFGPIGLIVLLVLVPKLISQRQE